MIDCLVKPAGHFDSRYLALPAVDDYISSITGTLSVTYITVCCKVNYERVDQILQGNRNPSYE